MALTFFASCPRYVEGLLAQEVTRLSEVEGNPVSVAETTGGVTFVSSVSLAYRLCLWSRLASRVYLRLVTGNPKDANELYALATQVAWENHFSPDKRFLVDNSVHHPAFRNPSFASLRVKDAIVDRFRDTRGVRPTVSTETPDVRVFLYLTSREAALYFDLSGESLHRRGYRRNATEAPLRENTAAAVLHRAGWYEALKEWLQGGDLPFLADPMCGSGTICIEASLMAIDAAPGLLRKRFGHQNWLQGDGEVWESLLGEATERREEGLSRWTSAGGRIWASDVDTKAVEAARNNALAAGVRDVIDFGTIDFRRLTSGPVLGRLNKAGSTQELPPYFVITNPPYGVRLSTPAEVDDLYRQLGKWMSTTLPRFTAAVLAASKEQARQLGLRAEKVNVLYNGSLKIHLAILRLLPENRFSPERRQKEGVVMLINRFDKNQKRLSRYLESRQLSCYRLYDADIPQYAAAIDVYESVSGETWAVLQEYAPPKSVDPSAASERLEELQQATTAFMEIPETQLLTKKRSRQRGRSQYTPSRGGTSQTLTIVEDELLFEVNLSDYIDTGIFLDARELRLMVAAEAAEKRFLNLFSYTCSASVYAAAEGASTVSVDTSNTYLSWGQRNFALNRLDLSEHRFVREDCLEYLRGDSRRYDVILIDPPTFSNRKGRDNDFDVQRDHPELIYRAFDRLAPDGTLFFSTNFRKFTLDSAIERDFLATDLSPAVLPADFSRRKDFRSTWKLVARSNSE